MRCLEKLPEDRFVSMDEFLGALVGLGLYALPRAEMGAKQKRGADDERRMRVSPGGASLDSGSRHGDDSADMPGWKRDRLRRSARRARTRRRYMIGAAVAAVAIIAAIVVVLVLTLSGGRAPYVKGLTLDQARQAAADAGMQVEVTALIPSFDKKAGTVLEQSPDKGLKSDNGVLQLTVTRQPTPVAVTQIKAYDPPPGDGKENDAQLPNLIDGKESTTWSTELYKSPAFGNLKAGVGLDFTLAEPATIMVIISTVDGWAGELRQSTSSGSEATITKLAGKPSQILSLLQPISSGRIWFTKLVELSDARYGVELSELRFYK